MHHRLHKLYQKSIRRTILGYLGFSDGDGDDGGRAKTAFKRTVNPLVAAQHREVVRLFQTPGAVHRYTGKGEVDKESPASHVATTYEAPPDHLVAVISINERGNAFVAFSISNEGNDGRNLVSADSFWEEFKKLNPFSKVDLGAPGLVQLLDELGQTAPALMGVVPAGTRKADHEIFYDTLVGCFGGARITMPDTEEEESRMVAALVTFDDGLTLRLVVNQLGVDDSSDTAERHLCQRSIQSVKTARSGHLTVIIDIPRKPASVRTAAAASQE